MTERLSDILNDNNVRGTNDPGQQYGNQQYGNQQYSGQPYGNQQYGGQQWGGQPYGGQPYGANHPQPVRGWSWGAFMFSIPFGIGNKAYLTLLTLVPLLNFVWLFVCGAKGHEWAQNSGAYATVEEFNAAMGSWDRAGKVFFFIALAFFALYLILVIAGVAAFGSLGRYY